MPAKAYRITCANHPDVEAVEKCVDCGKFHCRECIIKIDGRFHCRKCTDLLANLSETIGFEEKYNFKKLRVLMGGCFVIAIVGILAMLALLIFPYIRYKNAIQCSRQMKQVYQVMFAYAEDNNGLFPYRDNDLAVLYSPMYSKGIDLFRALKCPGTKNVVGLPAHLRDDSTEVVGPGMSYLYKGGLRRSTDEKENEPLFWDQSAENHRWEGINVLKTNGSVKFMKGSKPE